MKIRLRHFNNKDCDFISQKLFPNTPHEETITMINEWDTLQYKGAYFEMFAIEVDSEIAGCASLYEIAENASVGIEIMPEHRSKGIGSLAAIDAMRLAKEQGYKKATARVLIENLPSLRLCEKVGFTIINNDTTAAGKPVCYLEKIL